jgi:hypothetical protein
VAASGKMEFAPNDDWADSIRDEALAMLEGGAS